MAKGKRTTNNLQNTTQKTKDRANHYTENEGSSKTLHRKLKIEHNTTQKTKDRAKHYTENQRSSTTRRRKLKIEQHESH